MPQQVLFILAAVAFGIGAFPNPSKINWTSLGFCLLTIAVFLV